MRQLWVDFACDELNQPQTHEASQAALGPVPLTINAFSPVWAGG